MALRRMLWKRVSTSRKVNKLSLKAALLWTWSQPHLDVEGYIEAEPDYLKHTVVPRRKDIRESDISKLVQEIIDIGLWGVYQCNGVLVVRELKFEEMQSVKKQDEAPSLFADKLSKIETTSEVPQMENVAPAEEPRANIIEGNVVKDNTIQDNKEKKMASPLALLLDRDKEFKEYFDKARKYFPDIGVWFGKSFKQYGKDAIEQNRDELLLTMKAIIAKETFEGEPWGYTTKTFLEIVRDKSIREQNKEKQGRMSHIRDIL